MAATGGNEAGSIALLPEATSRSIGTSAAVSSVAGAVKELIDNAFDAGATTIEVLLEDFGLAAIAVTDNGSGIRPCDFANMCRPNATSKLSTFEDLYSVSTMGFRGQALNALSNVSREVTITTKHASEALGAKLIFDSNGELKSRSSCARNVGTSVRVTCLFDRLPVRRAALTRNGRKELTRVLHAVQQLALARPDCKVTCFHADNAGKRVRLVSTQGKGDLRATVADLYGTSALDKLVVLQQYFSPAKENESNCSVDEEAKQHFSLTDDEVSMAEKFRLSGLVSSCAHDCGRSSGDRQFFLLNQRPCEMPSLSKEANEVYKQFNRHRYPALILHIQMPQSDLDVNVSADKRRALVAGERALRAAVRSALRACWTAQAGVCPTVGVGKRPMDGDGRMPPTYSASAEALLSEEYRSEQSPSLKAALSTPSSSFQKSWQISHHSTSGGPPAAKQSRMLDFGTPVPRQLSKPITKAATVEQPSTSAQTSHVHDDDVQPLDQVNVSVLQQQNQLPLAEVRKRRPVTVVEGELSLESIAAARKAAAQAKERRAKKSGRGFTAKVSASQNETAEHELTKFLSKSDFERMSVVGQFNRGFIVAQLGADLFVVDQHAGDEKHRFEWLNRTSAVQSQRLLKPLRLDLGAVAISALRDGAEIVSKNGFQLEYSQAQTDGDADVCAAWLVGAPVLHGEMFGVDDVAELAHSLTEAPGVLYRPRRVRKIFAMKACRSAIMIGQDLKMQKMKQVVHNLSNLDHPWNCPHGRPTVRHLMELKE